MASLDLDIIAKKRDNIKLFGKDIPLKIVSMRQHLQNEVILKELDEIPLDSMKNVEKGSKTITKYLMNIMEISKEDADKISREQFTAIREFMKRKEMLDQGFTNDDIDKMEKEAIKKEIAKPQKG
jgi:galactokinase/mevalonate kinase-like predicted kinase